MSAPDEPLKHFPLLRRVCEVLAAHHPQFLTVRQVSDLSNVTLATAGNQLRSDPALVECERRAVNKGYRYRLTEVGCAAVDAVRGTPMPVPASVGRRTGPTARVRAVIPDVITLAGEGVGPYVIGRRVGICAQTVHRILADHIDTASIQAGQA